MGTVHPFQKKHILREQVHYIEMGKSRSNIPYAFLAIILTKKLSSDEATRATTLIRNFTNKYRGGIHPLRMEVKNREIHIYPDTKNSHIPNQSEGTMTTMLRVWQALENTLGIQYQRFFNDRLLPFKERKL